MEEMMNSTGIEIAVKYSATTEQIGAAFMLGGGTLALFMLLVLGLLLPSLIRDAALIFEDMKKGRE